MSCENCVIKDREIVKLKEKLKKKVFICPNGISFTEAKITIPLIIKNIGIHKKFIDKIFSYITCMPNGHTFKTNTILEYFNLKGETFGDKVRPVLSLAICFGMVEKVRFSVKVEKDYSSPTKNIGRGHVYRIINRLSDCENIDSRIRETPMVFSCNLSSFGILTMVDVDGELTNEVQNAETKI